MAPEATSASMAICLPGNASSAKRADTSPMRTDPRVTTTNCTTTNMANTLRPTIGFRPAAISPKASITEPATARPASGVLASIPKIKRVLAMLIPRRSSVVPNTNAGNTLKSSGFRMFAAVASTKPLSAKLMAIKASMAIGGSGTTNTATSPMNAAGTNHSMRNAGFFCVSLRFGIMIASPMSGLHFDVVADATRDLHQTHAPLRVPLRLSNECSTRTYCAP